MFPTPHNSVLKICIVIIAVVAPMHSITTAVEPPITAIAVLNDPHEGQLVVAASNLGPNLGPNLGLRVLAVDDPVFAADDQRTMYTFPVTPSLVHKIEVTDNRMLVVGGEPGESAWGVLYQQVNRLPGEPLAFTSHPVARLNQFDDCLFDAALSPDGTQVLIVSLDGQARVQQLGIARQLVGKDESKTFRGHSAGVTGAVWLDSNTVATSSRDASIRVWNASTGILVRTLSQHTGEVTQLRRSPTNDLLAPETRPLVASAGLDRTVRFWQPTIGRLVRFCRLDGQTCSSMSWTAYGGALVVGTTAGQLLWIDPQTAAITRTEKVADDWVTAVTINQSNTIFYGTADGKLGSIAAKLKK